jgi:hypothetical protein
VGSLPLLLPAFTAAFGLSFALSMGELGARIAQIRDVRDVLRDDAAAAGIDIERVDMAVDTALATYTDARVHSFIGVLVERGRSNSAPPTTGRHHRRRSPRGNCLANPPRSPRGRPRVLHDGVSASRPSTCPRPSPQLPTVSARPFGESAGARAGTPLAGVGIALLGTQAVAAVALLIGRRSPRGARSAT